MKIIPDMIVPDSLLMWKEFEFVCGINPLNPKSDQHLISPYNITPESHIKVMRIKDMVNREGNFWLANKFSFSAH